MFEQLHSLTSSVDFSIDEGSCTGSLKISGALTEKKTREFKATVENSANAVDYFKLNLENVTAVDVSCIEALYTTCESLHRSNKPVHLEGICPIAFTSAVEDVGYSYHNWLCFGQ
ncbi:MAG: hypothetical protein MJE63_00630 [Proteobacteria bacterium]|nr:hypothetical protein [Pseudomonadota bacterium]